MNTTINKELTAAQAELAVADARLALMRLTIDDARAAKAAIEHELTTWEAAHPYANRAICNLAAIVGVPGVMTWLAHFDENALPDVVFEIKDGRVKLATFRSFLRYQLAPFADVAPEGGVACSN